MSTAQNLSQSCINGFQYLLSSLRGTAPRFLQQMPPSTIEIQFGKFRVWCGNLGALQTGYSSLDYRLRDSALMHQNVSQLLQQLDIALEESAAVVSGDRLPFDEESMPSDVSEESDDDTSNEYFLSTELSMRVTSITDILNNLYRLSYKIRHSSIRPSSTRASLIRAVDNETGIDLFDKFYEFESRHLIELFTNIRQGRTGNHVSSDILLKRLTRSNVLRRKQFRYWERHTRKLGIQLVPVRQTPGRERNPATEVRENVGLPQVQRHEVDPPVAEESHLSETDATPYDVARDDRTERETILSLASTALDADGKGIEVPKPPKEALNGDSFTCPYCWVVYPSKEGRGKSWKSHVLHDLSPYVCTYDTCNSANDLYHSRKVWVDHEEAVHRPSWRCRDHPEALYATSDSFQRHLLAEHDRTLSAEHLEDLANVSKLGRVDDRNLCPLCFQEQPFPKGLTNHLANHLERIAIFSLPRLTPAEDKSTDDAQLSNLFNIDSEGSSRRELFEGESEHSEDPTDSQWNYTEYPLHPITIMLNTSEELYNMLEYIARFFAALKFHIIRVRRTLGDYDEIAFNLASNNAGRCLSMTQKILARDLGVQAIAKDEDTLTEILWDIWRFLHKARSQFDEVDGSDLENQQKQIALNIEALGGLGIVHDILEGILQIFEGSISLNTGLSKIEEYQSALTTFLPAEVETALDLRDTQRMTESNEELPEMTRETTDTSESDGTTEALELSQTLDPRYLIAPARMFQPGEVFKTPWPEPVPGDPYIDGEETCYRDSLGECLWVSFRRFLVVANDSDHCTCV
ncbi:meiosis-specific serine threonine kinase mek1 [Fusarium coicis]|nr:meiosis-specific serine threonine kinase mek1 [Fusarium coicis]